MPRKPQEVRVISKVPEGYEITNPIALGLMIEGYKRLQKEKEQEVNAG